VMNLFGKKKAAPAPKLSESIQMLREAMVSLEKREVHLDKQRAQCLGQAKDKLKHKDKRGAMYLLKRAKLYEKQVEQIAGKKINIDRQVMALEAASSNKEIFNAMKDANTALKMSVKESDIDRVADVMEDINESISMSDELGDALSQPIGQPMDEDELSRELEEMESEMMDESLLEAPSVPVTAKSEVKVPSSAVSASKPEKIQGNRETVEVGGGSSSSSAARNVDDKEAKELKELEALMGMQ